MNQHSIVVTRHPALVDYLREIGLAMEDTPVLQHVTVDDVRDRRVIGVLPLSLAAYAASVVEVPLALPAELRGVELTIEQVRQYAGIAREYVVCDRRHVAIGDLDAALTSRRAGWAAEVAS